MEGEACGEMVSKWKIYLYKTKKKSNHVGTKYSHDKFSNIKPINKMSS